MENRTDLKELTVYEIMNLCECVDVFIRNKRYTEALMLNETIISELEFCVHRGKTSYNPLLQKVSNLKNDLLIMIKYKTIGGIN